MAQTIEDVNDRTILQQFHSLYKKQDAIEANIENVDAKVDKEKIDRQTADANLQKLIYQEATEIGNETASLRNDTNTNTNKIEYNTTQITALKSGKQDKLTAGANITIDENNVISASGGGVSSVKAENVDSESATSGQVLTANGSGGASWQNASGENEYLHTISFNIRYGGTIRYMFAYIRNKNSSTFTKSSLSKWLETLGFDGSGKPYPIVNDDQIYLLDTSLPNRLAEIIGIYGSGSGTISYSLKYADISLVDGNITISSDNLRAQIQSITDTVRTL